VYAPLADVPLTLLDALFARILTLYVVFGDKPVMVQDTLVADVVLNCVNEEPSFIEYSHMLQVVSAVAATVRLEDVLLESEMVTTGAAPSEVEKYAVEEAP
jgi:hypothetical protein